MNQFTLDFSDTYGKVEDGEYEVICTAASEDATPGGTIYAKVNLRIRNDINQPCKNQMIFHKCWQRKETGRYEMKDFNTIGAAMQLEAGKKYTSLQDVLDDFVGKCCRVSVKNETSEYNGKVYDNLNVKYFNKTNFPDCNHQFRNGEGIIQSAPITINDDDLPF